MADMLAAVQKVVWMMIAAWCKKPCEGLTQSLFADALDRC